MEYLVLTIYCFVLCLPLANQGVLSHLGLAVHTFILISQSSFCAVAPDAANATVLVS